MITRAAAVVLAAAALCACGGPARLAPDPKEPVNLAGSWRLNREASDDPQPMLERIQRDVMKRMQRRREDVDTDGDVPIDRPDDEDPSTGTQRTPRGQGQRGEGQHSGDSHGSGARRGFMQRSSYAQALGPLLSSDGLTVEQTAAQVVFVRGDRRRSFTPGGHSVVSVPEGVADQWSGWSGRDYVIEVRPQVGSRMVERYGLSADSHQLVEKITLTEEDLPKLEFTRVYERGDVAPRALPGN